MGKADMLRELRKVLRESFTLQHEGVAYAKLSRAQGVADGYMRALLDIGIASQKELSRIVAEERAKKLGPATQTLAPDAVESDTLAA